MIRNKIIDLIYEANLTRNRKTLPRRILKVGEEIGEVMEAYLGITSNFNHKNKTKNDLIEELIDVSIVVVDIGLTISDDRNYISDIENTFTMEQNMFEIFTWFSKIVSSSQQNDYNSCVCFCQRLFKHIYSVLLCITDEDYIHSEYTRKLNKWTTNLAKMPVIEDDV